MLKYLVLLAGVHVFGRLPRAWGYRLAEGAAAVAFLANGRLRRAVLDNVGYLLGPGAPAPLVRRTGREVLRNVACYYVDLMRFPRTKPQELLERWVTIDGYEHLAQALAQGRGAIIASAHFGNAEIAVQVAMAKGVPVVVPTEPLRPPALSRLVDGLRSSQGQRFMALSLGTMRTVVETVRRGGVVAVACDRDVQGQSILVPFCGAPARMPTGAVGLAMRRGAALILVLTYRRPGGRYEIVIEPPLPLVDTGRPREDLRANVIALTARLEAHLRREPGQWTVTEPVWDSARGEGA